MKIYKFNKKDFITLFHATNKLSAKKMIDSGMGLNINDYKNLVQDIANKVGISNKVITRVFSNWTRNENINRGEYQGGVSFYPTFNQARDIAKTYAEMAGEWKGNLIEMLIKSYARDIGRSFNCTEIQNIYNDVKENFTGALSTPVVVEVLIPEDMIVNKEDIGDDVELYTNDKVSSKYIRHIHVI